MNYKKIKEYSKTHFRNHLGYSIILGIMPGIIIAGLLFLFTYLLNALAVVIVPILILPIFTSFAISHANLTNMVVPTLKNGCSNFIDYFKEKYRGCFRFFINFLKSLLIGIIFYFFVLIIVYLIYKNTSTTFVDSLEELSKIIMSSPSLNTKEIIDLLSKNNFELFAFANLVTLISLGIFSLAFFFTLLRDEMSLYLRLSFGDESHIDYFKMLYKKNYRLNFKKINLIFFKTNWQIFILFILGFVGGSILGSSIVEVNQSCLCYSIGFAMLLSCLYLPFYFNNNEAIMEEMDDMLGKTSNILTREIMNSLARNKIISEEDTKNIIKMIEDMEKQQENNDSYNETDKDNMLNNNIDLNKEDSSNSEDEDKKENK